MIPTLILAGIVLGLLPRPWFLVGVVLAAAAWVLVLALSRPGMPIDATSMLGEFALAAINAGAAALVARRVARLVQAVRG